MADTAMHRMMMGAMQRMPAEHRAHMQSMMHGAGKPAAARPAAPARTPARPAPRPAARPAPRDTTAGVDHSKHQTGRP
jgi:hypothetical protein